MSGRIAFLGDTLLGGQADDVLGRHGYEHVLSGIAPLVADADLVVANLEGPLTRRERPATKDTSGRPRWWYRADPAGLTALVQLGVGVVGLANNHVMDHGAEGLSDTLAALDAAGVAHCGAGPDEASARRAAVVDVRGHRVAFVAALQRYRLYVGEGVYAGAGRPGTARLSAGRIAADVAAADGSPVVALVHWGRTYRPRTDRQVRLAGVVRAAGADLVVGHHPHIAQPVDLAPPAPVLHSLGNGAFGTAGRFAARGCAPYGMVAVVDLDDGGRLAALELRLLAVDNRTLDYRAVPATDSGADAFLATLIDPAAGWRREGGGRVRATLTPPIGE